MHIIRSDRNHGARYAEEARCDCNGFLFTPNNIGKGREEEVAKIMPDEPLPACKAVHKKFSQQFFMSRRIIREGGSVALRAMLRNSGSGSDETRARRITAPSILSRAGIWATPRHCRLVE